MSHVDEVQRARVGRPSFRPKPTDPGILEKLCDGLVGGQSMRSLCESPDMPTSSAVYIEMAKNEEFQAIIARARVAQHDAEADKTVDLADAATIEDYNVVKLRIWARQWRAGKLAPKKYGDRTTLAGDSDAPIQVQHTKKLDISALSEEQLDALEGALRATVLSIEGPKGD